jgi:hypothetical protein
MKKMLLLVLGVHTFFVHARFYTVSSDTDLQKHIGEYQYAVVCLTSSKDDAGVPVDIDQKKQNQKIKDAVRAASQSGQYRDFLREYVGFIFADISKHTDSMLAVVQAAHVPVCALFEQGVRTQTMKQSDQITALSLLDFIKEYAQSGIDQLIQEKKEQALLDQQERIARYRAYHWLPGYGPYWTYYGPRGWQGYGPYYPQYGPSFGVQFVHHSHH